MALQASDVALRVSIVNHLVGGDFVIDSGETFVPLLIVFGVLLGFGGAICAGATDIGAAAVVRLDVLYMVT